MSGSGLQRTGPDCHSGIARVRLALGFSAAFRTIELADGVSANFDDAVLRAFAFILARAHGSLHHYIRTFGQRSRELGLHSERSNPVPVRSALPLAIGALPGLLGRDRDRNDKSAILRVVSLGVVAAPWN